ncbi:MAG: hypothetical protein IM541_02935 [Chitinophagaceae bacterium]|nr:hypothetical protein [Chitinophagaceae bacterium]MCA6467816.1 hypothetical protein [Chitinophagaceae bacterium]MCA6470132.1 hypothetical protein [Chitinophagaceae bacterium]MCA6472967.1 hypothetical protein [Chitinophagaceae bacterium]MCA6474782.1 hypothetical protein [Chitinophagaceae bacterium]
MSQELIEGKDFYYDENGMTVFTPEYHLNKGYCCGHGCRHCPYDYINVPEPRKSYLLQSTDRQSSPPAPTH